MIETLCGLNNQDFVKKIEGVWGFNQWNDLWNQGKNPFSIGCEGQRVLYRWRSSSRFMIPQLIFERGVPSYYHFGLAGCFLFTFMSIITFPSIITFLSLSERATTLNNRTGLPSWPPMVKTNYSKSLLRPSLRWPEGYLT